MTDQNLKRLQVLAGIKPQNQAEHIVESLIRNSDTFLDIVRQYEHYFDKTQANRIISNLSEANTILKEKKEELIKNLETVPQKIKKIEKNSMDSSLYKQKKVIDYYKDKVDKFRKKVKK